MRIVFTGTSGLNDRHVLQRLASYIESEKHKSVRIIYAEEKIRERGKAEYYDFLDKIPSDGAVKRWSQSFGTTLREWELGNRGHREPDFSFLSLHLAYQVRSHFYCPLNWRSQGEAEIPGSDPKIVSGELVSFLKRFDPDSFVNLFDNVYAVQMRIKDYPFRLIELLRWRNIEMMMTDILADLVVGPERRADPRETPANVGRYKYQRSPIVPLRSSLNMVYRLLAEPDIDRIYLSYPISEPRRVQQRAGDDRLMREINSFRDFMRTRFIAFDPVTIDERPLKFLWEGFVDEKRRFIRTAAKRNLINLNLSILKGDTKLTLEETALWPVEESEYADMLCGSQKDYWEGLGITSKQKRQYILVADEVRHVVEEKKIWQGAAKGGEIDNQIARRDFRFIDQADGVVIYRPSLNRKNWPEGGTRSEYKYAKEIGKPVIIIRDKIDGSFDKPPFETTVNPFDVLEEEHLDDDAARTECFHRAEARIKQKIEQSLK